MQESHQIYILSNRSYNGEPSTSPGGAVLNIRKLCFILSQNQEISRCRRKNISFGEGPSPNSIFTIHYLCEYEHVLFFNFMDPSVLIKRNKRKNLKRIMTILNINIVLVHSENLINTNFIFSPIIPSLVLCIWNIKLFSSFYFMATFQISKPKHHTFPFTIFFHSLNINISFIDPLYGMFFQSLTILFLLYNCILLYKYLHRLWCL